MIFDGRKLSETLFGKNKTDEELEKETKPNVTTTNIITSDSAYTCSMGAKLCYGREVSKYYPENLKHIEKIMSYGHDSISAHSNIIELIRISGKNYHSDLLKNLPAMKYLNISTLYPKSDIYADYTETEESKRADNNPIPELNFMLIGGSIRAWRYYLYKMAKTNHQYDNIFYDALLQSIRCSMEKEFFVDMMEQGFINKDMQNEFFYKAIIDEDTYESDEKYGVIHQDIKSAGNVDFIHCDDLAYMEVLLAQQLGYKPEEKLDQEVLDAILDTACVTLRIHDYSRAISQQINRHQSGISQESQRFVNYKDAKFIDPLRFNPKKYDKSKKYSIELGGNKLKCTSEELGQMLISLYPQLERQGMINQDARSFLPMNVETKAIHTFTWTNLLHFIKLRTDFSAQPEVQKIATDMKELVLDQLNLCSKELKAEIIKRMESSVRDFI